MNNLNLFSIRNWAGKHFTSALEINEAAMKGFVSRSVEETTYGAYYTYTTLEGVEICKFYKDSSFGFSSQAYGVEIPSPYILFPAVRKEIDAFS